MFVCKEHLEIAIDDALVEETLPVISEVTTEQLCSYCQERAQYEIIGKEIRIEY
ncbi:MAG: CxxH/CxxC protein [Culicoidibacterales bacterium]